MHMHGKFWAREPELEEQDRRKKANHELVNCWKAMNSLGHGEGRMNHRRKFGEINVFHQIKTCEVSYVAYDLEPAGVVIVIKIWRYYLYEDKCTLYTNLKGLYYFINVVKDYDCEILYHPGKANVVADALSNKTHNTLF
ncbi:hypothetical protein OSB04_006681 [Centaurea solstitialis]|uniref:Uncharacterized protein n=1 Tax=Centaurea solstitialis TaxID=347529 RepID=A0AA38TTX7_9ASTR|nr:hypothetical protein OSB04_006681 [Centaurea solstitialis]